MYHEIINEKRIVIGRENILELITKEKKSIALIGQLHIGKSTIAKEYACRENGIYIDLSRIGVVPEDFCVSFLLAVTSWHLKKDVRSLDDCKINDNCSMIVDAVKNELLKIKPDHRLLVESAFRFCSVLGKNVVIDGFWRILDLNNFDAIDNVLAIFKQFVNSSKYILIGSYERLMKDLCKKLGIEAVEISGLKLRDINDDALHYYSNGVPLYLNSIKSRGGNARESFLTECLWKSGTIYNSSLVKLNFSLYRARGKGLLMSVLKVLCKSNGMRLSEVSRAIYRSAAVTKNLISRLEDVDLIVKEGNLFLFKDIVLKFWFRHYIDMIEFDFLPSKNELRKIEVDL